MKKILSIALSLLLVAVMLPVGIFTATADTFTLNDAIYNGDVKVNVPTSWWSTGISYTRIIQLHNGTAADNNALLATFSEHSRGVKEEDDTTYEVGYPIYRSNDLGQSWEFITRVKDPVNDSTQRAEWMPTLYELPEDFGDFKKGTILLAGTSHDDLQETNTAIQLYASFDGGYNWDFISTIVTGGAAAANEEAGIAKTGVYEPELELINGELVCYFSDETSDKFSQRIAYKTSKNGSDWSGTVDVVAIEGDTHRPGMPVVTKTANGYFMVYEMVGEMDGACYYRTSTNGLDWGDKKNMGTAIASGDYAPFAAPYCEWTPYGGENGTLFVSAANISKTDVLSYFVSQDNGATWSVVDHPVEADDRDGSGYSNSMTFSADGKILFAINNPAETVTETEDEAGDTVTKVTTCVKTATVELEAGAASLPENQYGTTSVADLVESASGYNSSNVSWAEDFTSATASPIKMHPGQEGVNAVVDGRWQIGRTETNRANFSMTGLLSNRAIGDFAISFDVYIASDYGDRRYVFHDDTGWANCYDSYIRFNGSATAEHSVTLVNGGNSVTSETLLPKGYTYNVVLVSRGTLAELYVWEKGKTAPSVPTLAVYSDTEKTGDFHLETYDANDFVDNIKIYEPDTVLSHEEISAVVGKEVNEDNLKYENYFSGAEDIFEMNNAAVNTVSAGKWNISTNSAASANTTAGFTGNSNLGDFVMAFEYTRVTGDGARNFMFHRAAAGNADESGTDSFLQIMWNGSVKIYNNGVTDATDANFVARNVAYNVVVKSVGATAEAYVWEKGTEAPTAPTVSATSDVALTGDVYIDFYNVIGEFADSIRIYELGIDKALISSVAGVKDEQIIYENDFSSGDVPVEMAETRVNKIVDGRWQLGGNTTKHYSTTGLTGNTKIRDFVLSFEFTRGEKWGTRNVQFHRTSGSATQANYSYFRFNYNGEISISNAGVVDTITMDLTAGNPYNIIVKSIGDTISAYVWAKGSAVPTEPTVSATATTTDMGDIYFDFYDVAGDYFDNIVVYELPVSTDEIAAVTGETLTDDMLLVEDYINGTTVPAKRYPDYVGVSEVKDDQWYLSKENATRTGLVGYDITDFVAAFEFKATTKWGSRRFSFHTNTGWPDQQDSYLRFDFVSGDANQYLVPKLYHGDEIATTDMVIDVNKYYNVVIKSVGYTVSAYIWEKGAAAPSAPTLTATSETASTTGDLYLYTYDANDYIDNIRVYRVGEEMTLLCSAPLDIRTKFVSGIIAEFGYAPMEGMQVIEQGITVNCGDESKTIKLGNDTNVLTAVITGDFTGKTVTAQAYLTFKTATGVQYTLYSYTEKASETLLDRYVKATYGDATGDGQVNILDLIRMKKAIAGTAETIVSANVEYDGIDGLAGSDLTMQKKVLLCGVENLVPTDVEYINF